MIPNSQFDVVFFQVPENDENSKLELDLKRQPLTKK